MYVCMYVFVYVCTYVHMPCSIYVTVVFLQHTRAQHSHVLLASTSKDPGLAAVTDHEHTVLMEVLTQLIW